EASKGRIVVVGSEGYKMGLRTIQFEDMNFDHNYHPNNTYAHSKLAQIMTAYALQRRIAAAGKHTKVYVCHPGASKTSLIRNDAPLATRITWSLLSRLPIVQTAEKGAYPEVMCATEANLKERAFYGPTGMMQWSGPVGECTIEPFVFEQTIADRLWERSEEATGTKWNPLN
ncbi:MAG: oxidoreductase, partial [Bacteroidota bacterium]